MSKRGHTITAFDHRSSGGWLFAPDEAIDDDDDDFSSSDTSAKMPIMHIVLFEFKPTITHAQVEDVCL